MRNSAGPDDAPDSAPDQHARPRHVAPLRTANDRTARLGLERPPTTAEFHTRPLGKRLGQLGKRLAGRPVEPDRGQVVERRAPTVQDRHRHAGGSGLIG